MKLALMQAHKFLGNTNENPSVGCVIVKNNSVISAGCTSLGGRPHAEYNAINFSRHKLKNTYLYVTVEPCCNFGKTPPCVDLIKNIKFKKVFFSINDPDIRTNNKSKRILETKGIKVNKGLLSDEVNIFYRSYVKNRKKNLPFITCKLAITKDFYITNKDKKKWITNKYSRGRVHLMRSNHDCIMTSSNTVIDDNPRLTCRINGLEKLSPSRIILDSKLRIPIKSKIFDEANNFNTYIFYNKINNKKLKKLKKLKIKTCRISLTHNSQLDLRLCLKKAKQLGFYRIFLESGIKLVTNFFKNNLIDDLQLFISKDKIGKHGKVNVKNILNSFIKNKERKYCKANLFGDQLISYKIK